MQEEKLICRHSYSKEKTIKEKINNKKKDFNEHKQSKTDFMHASLEI